MIHQVRITVFIEDMTKTDMQALEQLVKLYAAKAVNINEGSDNQEVSFAELRECHHDDPDRYTPDVILARWEVGRGRVLP